MPRYPLWYRLTAAAVIGIAARNVSFGNTASQPIFARDVLPILRAHCTKCHGLEDHKAKLDLRTKKLILHGGTSGTAIEPGSPEKSRLFKRIASREMPPDGELDLTDAQIDTVRQWIDAGAPVRSAARPLSRREAPPLQDEDREFWAFTKLRRPEIPGVDHGDRVGSPIDAFVWAALEKTSLQLSPRADRVTLARRVYFDLLGLPPSPRDVEEFVLDDTPAAYERLVDRLLASPHFGERWARYWLDAAGYAEVRGTDFDAGLNLSNDFASNLWRYRDYVIAALNDDKPFDRFVLEQLAGDELVDWRDCESLSEDAQQTLVATGFLRTAHALTWDPPDDTATTRFGVLQRTVAAVTNNLLGLTVGCAQCHSHKFDPISQLDYYRFTALFTPAFNPQSWLIPGKRDVARGEFAAHALYDVGPAPVTYLLRRGEFIRPGPEVRPGFPRVLCDSDDEAVDVTAEPVGATSGRRLALAQWLTRPNSRAAALVARVRINRVWEHIFGRGLVRSSENFGRQGEPPTHPKLLDWLAKEFIDNDWRLKPLLKRILTSEVYRQSSTDKPDHPGRHVDPGNRLLWKRPLRRLTSEAISDSILAVSGKIDRTVGGHSVLTIALPDGRVTVSTEKLPTPTSQWRRSVYLLARRNYHPTIMSVFDQPRMGGNCVRRERSAVVLQSLTMFNDDFVVEQAKFFADRVQTEAEPTPNAWVSRAFLLALAREPASEELSESQAFLKRQTARFQASGSLQKESETKALATLCQVLLNTSEFIYVE